MRLLKLFLLSVLFTTGIALAEAPVVAKIAPTTCLTIQECVMYYGDKYNLSKEKKELMKKVIWCESSNNRYAVGDGGKSFGLSQIHSPSHPHVTKAQAFDIDYAIDFMAREFSKNNQGIWSCTRIVLS